MGVYCILKNLCDSLYPFFVGIGNSHTAFECRLHWPNHINLYVLFFFSFTAFFCFFLVSVVTLSFVMQIFYKLIWIMFVIIFSLGAGPVPSVLMPEILPGKILANAMSICLAMHGLIFFCICLMTPQIIHFLNLLDVINSFGES